MWWVVMPEKGAAALRATEMLLAMTEAVIGPIFEFELLQAGSAQISPPQLSADRRTAEATCRVSRR